jgi:hypothetical protein
VKVTLLALDLDEPGVPARTVTHLGALLAAGGHDVRLLSVRRSGDGPPQALDGPRATALATEHLLDVRAEVPRSLVARDLAADEAADLHAAPSTLAPADWSWQTSALTDLALEAALADLATDVLVTTTPALLAAAVQLAPAGTAVVHLEQRPAPALADEGSTARVAARADAVVVSSRAAADLVRPALGPLAPRVHTVPPVLAPGHRPMARHAPRSGGVIVGEGRMSTAQQWDALVRAFGTVAERLPGWRLRILGHGERHNDLVALTRRLELHDRVELPGHAADLAAEWARADVAAWTARVDGTGLGLLEAMAAGVPVAAYDAPTGVREVLIDDHNGLVVAPGSEAGMAAALVRLADDPQLRRRLGAGARETASAYPAEELIAAWDGVLDAAVRGHTVPGRPSAGGGRLARSLVDRRPGTRPAPGEAPPGVSGAEVTPSQARQLALRTAADAARAAAGDHWFVVPPRPGEPALVVVPMARRRATLDALAAADVPAWMCLHDPGDQHWPERHDDVAVLARELQRGRTTRVALEPWPTAGGRRTMLGQGCSVDLEFWPEGPDGELLAPRPTRFLAEVPAGDRPTATVAVAGLELPTFGLMTWPTVEDCRFAVDVVCTWVDASDEEWNASREERLAEVSGIGRDRRSSGRARFADHDELRHALRSVHLFAPWVRTVHLVTAGQRPAWLADHPAVRLVDHREILPPEALPTFNSHAIEAALHRVPDLAEHFVYLNDDVFLGRPLTPQHFFSPAGSPAVFPAAGTLGLDDPDAAPYLLAAQNNRRLLREAFGAVPLHLLAHTPHPHRVSTLREVEERFPDAVAGTRRSPFRSETDVSMLSSLAQHYGLLTGQAHVAPLEKQFVDITRASLRRDLRTLLATRDVDSFCLGDHHQTALRPGAVDDVLAEFMAGYVPLPAPWERT